MADNAPNILIVDDEPDERALIAAVLREAGFAVVETAAARAARTAMNRERFTAAIIALPDGEGIELRCDARRRQPGLAVLGVVGPRALRLADEDCSTLVRRPVDPRQLLGCAFEMVLRENEPDSEQGSGPHRGHAAELGIAAAELACLDSRRSAAAAAGASRLAQDLTRQIGETRALCTRLTSAVTTGGFAAAGAPAD